MVSDINVIKELSDYEDKFRTLRTPIFSQLTGNQNDTIYAPNTFTFKKFEIIWAPSFDRTV